MRKKILMGIVTALCISSGMTVYAAPEIMPDGTVFDAEYYAETYPDLKAAFGNDTDALYDHYVKFGKAEGRQPAAENVVAEEIPKTEVQEAGEHKGVLNGFYSYADDHMIVSKDGLLVLYLDDLLWFDFDTDYERSGPKVYYAEDGMLTIETNKNVSTLFDYNVIIDGEYLKKPDVQYIDQDWHSPSMAGNVSIGAQNIFDRLSISGNRLFSYSSIKCDEPIIFNFNIKCRGDVIKDVQLPIRLITVPESWFKLVDGERVSDQVRAYGIHGKTFYSSTFPRR